MSMTLIAAALTEEHLAQIVEDGGFLEEDGGFFMFPTDMGNEIAGNVDFYLGAEVWCFDIGGGQAGTAIRTKSGEGGMCWNGDTSWGSWRGNVFTVDDADRLSFGEDGEEIEEDDA